MPVTGKACPTFAKDGKPSNIGKVQAHRARQLPPAKPSSLQHKDPCAPRHSADPSARTADAKQQADQLKCRHFSSCSGCALNTNLSQPPSAREAASFFNSLGVTDFPVRLSKVHNWRCRAKLAVRSRHGKPVIGLFREGSHMVVPIPDCVIHHPRINQAVELIFQVVRQLNIPCYDDTSGLGFLRYLQLTAVASRGHVRAEEDPFAQVQVVFVWASADDNHPSFSLCRQLCQALQAAAGSKPAFQPRRETYSVHKQSPTLRHHQPAVSALPAASNGTDSKFSGKRSVTSGSQAAGLLHSIWVNFQPEKDSNRVLGISGWRHMLGPSLVWQQFGQANVCLGPDSFIQANYGAFQLALLAIHAIVPAGSRVLELHAGVGAIGLSLLASSVTSPAQASSATTTTIGSNAFSATSRLMSLTCVEINPNAQQYFQHTVDEMLSGKHSSVSYVSAAAGSQQVLQLLGSADVVIVDPPRKGLEASLLDTLATGHWQQPQPIRGHDVQSSPSDDVGCIATRSKLGHSSMSSAGADQQQPTTVPQQMMGNSQKQHVANGPHTLIYLSCGWQALKKELPLLLSGTAGWKVRSAEAFCFFPGTDSIETLVVLSRANS